MNSSVIHAKSGENHLVSVDELRVLITEEPDGWFAQGVEIDYYASGETLEDVKIRFTNGLAGSIRAHISKFGELTRLIKWAPYDVVQKVKGNEYSYSQVIGFNCNEDPIACDFPFNNLRFMSEERSRTA